MKQHRLEFSIEAMCRALEVSKSGYFEWAQRQLSTTQLENERLSLQIQDVHQKSRKNYGYRRIHAELRAQGVPCSVNRISRLMRKKGLKAKTVKKFKATTNSNHKFPIQKNLLNRDFSATAINQRWAGDITYIPTQEGWLYLSVVLDLYSRKVVGWAMSSRMTTSLVSGALLMALKQRGMRLAPSLLWHSDRGSQYASSEYQNLLKEYQITGSMSRKGNCWDNAVSESFFGTLKKELVHHEKYFRRGEAEKSIFEYIEVFYNRQRRHSTLGYRSPVEYEKLKIAA